MFCCSVELVVVDTTPEPLNEISARKALVLYCYTKININLKVNIKPW